MKVALVDGEAAGDGLGFLEFALLIDILDEHSEPAFLAACFGIPTLVHGPLSAEIFQLVLKRRIGGIEQQGVLARGDRLIPGRELGKQVFGLQETALGGLLLTSQNVQHARGVPSADLTAPLVRFDRSVEELQRQGPVVDVLEPGELGSGELLDRMRALDLAHLPAAGGFAGPIEVLHRRLVHRLVS